jgi:membrane protein required for colicin V production
MLNAQFNINLFDGTVFTILFLSALLSFFRGFIREALSLGAWVGAGMITLFFTKDIAQFIKPYVKSDAAAIIFGTMGTYFLALTVISIINTVIAKYLKSGSDVGAFDNFFGVIFGLIKGSAIITLAYFLATLVWGEDKEKYPEIVKTAYTRPAVEKGTDIMKKLLPTYIMKPLTTKDTKEKDGEDDKTVEKTVKLDDMTKQDASDEKSSSSKSSSKESKKDEPSTDASEEEKQFQNILQNIMKPEKNNKE